MSATVEGLNLLLANVDKAERQMAIKIAEAMEEAMRILLAEYRRQMKVMIYDRPESPNYQRTYRLYDEAFWAVAPEIMRGIVSGAVGNRTDYAVFVELGTRYVAARPALQAAIEGSWNEIVSIFSRVLNISIQPVSVVFTASYDW
jgi:HK97 gp10 family phage protein